jgi:hypothetical protein
MVQQPEIGEDFIKSIIERFDPCSIRMTKQPDIRGQLIGLFCATDYVLRKVCQ